MYKYNLLHRASVRNSLYITSAKKFIGSGFYNKNLGVRNVWASSTFSTLSSNQPLTSGLHSALYGDSSLLDSRGGLSHSSPFHNKATLASLSFYESSYHWSLQRFYQFSSLPANGAVFGRSLSATPSYLKTSSGYTNAQNEFSAALTSTARLYSAGPSSLTLNLSSTLSEVSSSPYSDTHLDYSAHALFNKERLEALQNLAKNRTSSSVLTHNHSFVKSPSLPTYSSQFTK